MVMETPSAQCVGREFVRQYYTLLHEAPEYLHRFYSHNSCFVHGGVEKPGEEQPPVQGQADIHKKILSLNFRDCHAKIRQVDSQSTVGSAVVVQVTGELSNNGQPMRRFMQTFILAPQSPKKYYVHNDIFRYQDEVFHDNDTEAELGSEDPAAEDLNYNADSETEQIDTSSQPENVHDTPILAGTTTVSYFDIPGQAATTVLSNGNSVAEDRPETPEEKVMEETEMIEPVEVEAVVHEYEPSTKHTEKNEQVSEEEPVEETAHFNPTQEAKTNSWAFITSKNTSGGMAKPAQSVAVVNQKPIQQSPRDPPIPKPAEKIDMGPPGINRDGPKPPRDQREPRQQRPNREQRDNSRSGPLGGNNSMGGDDFRTRSRFPDSQQLFVGNLPHNITETELEKYFESYGKVVDVRINRKSNNRDVPNFGFVVFDDPQTVTTVLDSKPIMYRGDHRLNVEEKKQRSEQGMRPGSGNRLGRGAMIGGPGRGGIGMGGHIVDRDRQGGMGGGRGGPRGGGSSRGGMDRGSAERSGRGDRGGGFGVPRR